MSNKNDIEIVLQAKDETSGALDKTSAELRGMGAAAQKSAAELSSASKAAGLYYDKLGRLHAANGKFAPMGGAVKKAAQDSAEGLAAVTNAAKATEKQTNSLTQSVNGLGSIFRNAVSFAAGIAGFNGITAAVKGTVGAIAGFKKSMEVNETGIAGILLSMTEMDGKALTWNESINLSKNIMAQLNSEAMRTAATTDELTNAFRGILGPGLNAGMTIDQLVKLTSAGANAVKSIMPGNAAAQVQIVQELRDLVAGGIQPASSTLATALGLRDSDIKKAKESADGLYVFLMDRLKGFETSAPYYAKTFTGLWDQIVEGFTLAGSQGTDGIFNAVKEELNELAGYVVAFNKETNKMEVNPSLISGFKSVSEVILDGAHGLNSFTQTMSKVVVPAVNVLGNGIQVAAKNAELLAYAGTTWYVLGKVSTANTILLNFWRKAVEQTTEKYALQAAASEVAGQAASSAAIKAAASQQVLTAAVGETTAAQLASGTAASAASATTVTSMAVAKTASINFLYGLKALAGGWLGVAVATGYAIKALYDYFDAKGKIESYNPKAEVYEDGGKLYKKVEKLTPLWGGKVNSVSYEKQELSEGEYAEHDRWKAWKDKMENEKPWDINTEAVLSKITAKFNTAPDSTGGGSGGGSSADNKTEKYISKINELYNDLSQKILEHTGTTYELGMGKINAELSKVQDKIREASAFGIDTTALEAKAKEYAVAMTEPLIKAWKEAWTDLKTQTALGMATLKGDTVQAAKVQEQISLAALEKEKENRLKAVQMNKEDTEAALAVEQWYSNQVALLAQKRAEAVMNAKTTEFDNLIEINSLMVQTREKSQEQIDALNADLLQKKIAYLQNELDHENLTTSEILMLRQKLGNAKKDLENTPTMRSDGIKAGLKEYFDSLGTEAKQWQDAAKNMAGSLTNAFQSMFFDVMKGNIDDLGDYFKSFLEDVQNQIARVFAQQASKAFLHFIMPGMFATGGRVGLGSTFIAGDHGPELIRLDGAGASITSSGTTASKRAGASGCPVTVNVINNTGTQAEVSQDVSFDGDNYIITVVMDAVSRDRNGMRSMLAALR